MLGRKQDHFAPAHRIAKYISEVVMAATASPKGQQKHSSVRCRRSPQHRKCPGRLLVCERGDGDIEYQCSCCSEHGVIRGWQGSLSDLSDLREENQRTAFEILLAEREYDDLKRALAADIEGDLIIYGATYTADGIILRGDAVEIKMFVGCLTDNLKQAENPRHRRVLSQLLHRVQAVLGKWSPG